MTENFLIGNTRVGHKMPTFLVAELSANHCGSKEKALELVKEASLAGANAVKLQTYTADSLTLKSNLDDFQIKSGPWKSYHSLWNLYDEACTPYEWHRELFDYARSIGLEVFSSPFDEEAVDFLETLNPPAYKIASPEINHIPLIKRVAQTGKPVLLSTGLATLEDLDLAICTLKDNGTSNIVILKCTTEYPAPLEEANLLNLKYLSDRYKCVIGLSDHTLGSVAALTSVALGAKVIEKHFCLDKNDGSVDSFFSLDKSEFNDLVKLVRNVETVLGSESYGLSKSVVEKRCGMRSLYVSKNIDAGDVFSSFNIKCVRPSSGLHPKYYEIILGRYAVRCLKAGERLTLEDVCLE